VAADGTLFAGLHNGAARIPPKEELTSFATLNRGGQV
jgi:hypothetical protein